jgi:cytochrome c oxidase subunit IV
MNRRREHKEPQLYEAQSATVVAGPAIVWAVLLVLLAVNIVLAHLPLGKAKAPLNLLLATVQASLMFSVFMRLNRASTLVKLTAGAAFLWLSFLFIIGSTDYFTRPAISP